ncbi:hypothetical protein C2G38_2207512 [Gigaspora rosea]|uniref:Uncharacterized protein n=1 Tax=Gigaspora rosea TaxID=44941 RepID=A0A397UKB2_9GLOM|nr:hypothetical protein C2G38_2207512 [Gigaspora rosea]
MAFKPFFNWLQNRSFIKETDIIKKIKQLCGTKEGDIKRIGDIFETRNIPKYMADTLPNTSGGQERKKRKANDASVASVALSAMQRELPHSISRSEVYKSINFELATTKKLLIKPVKLQNLPGELQKYLAKKPKQNQDTPEKEVQA